MKLVTAAAAELLALAKVSDDPEAATRALLAPQRAQHAARVVELRVKVAADSDASFAEQVAELSPAIKEILVYEAAKVSWLGEGERIQERGSRAYAEADAINWRHDRRRDQNSRALRASVSAEVAELRDRHHAMDELSWRHQLPAHWSAAAHGPWVADLNAAGAALAALELVPAPSAKELEHVGAMVAALAPERWAAAHRELTRVVTAEMVLERMREPEAAGAEP